MNPIQQVVDELRFFLQRETVEPAAGLATAVEHYARVCHDINNRLRRCDHFVKQGLRSEAIHLADAPPNLLDAVAMLDIPELDQLDQVARSCAVPLPEPLLLDAAAALNEAYALHEPLQNLLNTHRLMALGHCPLGERLPVLRSLAALDKDSPHWQADVREMERARLREIDDEARTAATRSDARTLKSLQNELLTGEWLETVPAELIRQIKSRINHATRTNAQVQTEEVRRNLRAAYTAQNEERARTLRNDWNQLQQILQTPADGPQDSQIATIFNWLDEVERQHQSDVAYARMVADIESALSADDLSLDAVQRMKTAAERHGRCLPEALRSRIRSREEAIKRASLKRRWLRIGATVASVMLFALTVGAVTSYSTQTEKSQRIAAVVSDLIDEGKLSEAREFFKQLPGASTSNAWATVRSKLVDAEQIERERVARWRTEVETAREGVNAAQVEAALHHAHQFARTTEEKMVVDTIQSTWRKRVADEVSVRDRALRDNIASAKIGLQALQEALRNASHADLDRLRALLNDADGRFQKMRSTCESASKELASQAESLEPKLAALRKSIIDLNQKSVLLEKLTDAVLIEPGTGQATTKSGNYEAVLREFAKTLPDDPRATAFQAAADSSPLPVVLARQRLLERWKRLRPADADDVQARIREVRKFLADFPQCPDRDGMSRYEAWLTSVARRFEIDGDPDQGILSRIAVMLNSRFIRESHILRDTDGHTYYLPEPRDLSKGSLASFKYLVGFNGETKSETLKPEQLVATATAAAPQQEIASKLRTRLRETALDGWQRDCQEAAETWLAARQLDPFLRYLLVSKTLEFASLGDQILEQDLAPLLEALQDEHLDRSVAWMDPWNAGAIQARDRAGKLLTHIPPLAPLFAAASRRQAQLEQDVFQQRFSIGWLQRQEQGDWICRTKFSSPVERELLVLERSEPTAPWTWARLGKMRGTEITIERAVADRVGEAVVVFSSTAAPESKAAQAP